MLNYKQKNVNPKGRKTGDCSTRAIAECLGITWEQALKLQYEVSLKTKYGITDRQVIEKVLEQFGYEKQKQPRKYDNTKYEVREMDRWLTEKDREKPIICNVANHYVVIEGNDYVDIWNSGRKTVGNYYQFFASKNNIDKYNKAKEELK